MLIVDFVNAIISLSETIDIPDSKKKECRKKIFEIGSKITPNPREETEDNSQFLNIILIMLLEKVEALYGDADGTELHFDPFFINERNSKIVKIKDQTKFGIGIAPFAISWEQIFYQISHEVVHLLNPICNIKEEPVCALEEGVAVKFAEKIYKQHISTFTQKSPEYSPTIAIQSPYYSAFQATTKIPDPVLREIRKEFGRFSSITNLCIFRSLVSDYLCEKEICLLQAPFAYQIQK